jgi:hypothetical protein
MPEPLGHGRSGSVYPVRLDDTEQNSLPPLVMKVAARRRSENLTREAWFYEEMENIQGASIARCYGFFTAEIDSNSEVLGWAESDARYDPNEEVNHFNEKDDDDYIPKHKDEGTTEEDTAWSLPGSDASYNPLWSSIGSDAKYNPPWGLPESDAKYNRDEEIDLLDKEDDPSDEADCFPETKEDSVIISNHTVPPPASDGNERTFISILVLERLGDVIPVLVSLKDIEFVPSLLFFSCLFKQPVIQTGYP